MKKLELEFDLIGLEGQKIAVAGKVVAGLLMSEVKGDAIKFFDWAMTLQAGKPIEVDASDFTTLKDLLTKAESLTILAKAPILRYLDGVKEKVK